MYILSWIQNKIWS